jgi:hypothetical protein
MTVAAQLPNAPHERKACVLVSKAASSSFSLERAIAAASSSVNFGLAGILAPVSPIHPPQDDPPGVDLHWPNISLRYRAS